LILGIGLSLAPIGAFIAVTGFFKLLPLLFSSMVLFWVSGFDIIYALQDVEFDKSQHLKSIPVKIGIANSLKVSLILHIITAIFVVFAGFYGHFGIYFWIGATIFIFLLFYQHIIISSKDLSKINIAFFTTNGIASVLFAIFVIIAMYY